MDVYTNFLRLHFTLTPLTPLAPQRLTRGDTHSMMNLPLLRATTRSRNLVVKQSTVDVRCHLRSRRGDVYTSVKRHGRGSSTTVTYGSSDRSGSDDERSTQREQQRQETVVVVAGEENQNERHEQRQQRPTAAALALEQLREWRRGRGKVFSLAQTLLVPAALWPLPDAVNSTVEPVAQLSVGGPLHSVGSYATRLPIKIKG